MTKSFLLAAISILLSAAFVFTQTPPENTSETASLEKILNETEKQTANYREAFKNLLAVETKTFERFDKNEEVKDRTTIDSNFFVYQSAKNDKVSSELRNVIRVDGKPVQNSGERADRFLAELQKAQTVESELEKIQNEGNRFDKTWEISGLTLNQGIFLGEKLRPYFEYKLLGRENLDGREFYLVSYRQTRKSPEILINEKPPKGKHVETIFDADIPNSLKKSDVFFLGKIWIDAKTFQIRREERDLTVRSSNPLVLIRTVFEYAPSEFEILVPKKITFTEHQLKKNSRSGDYSAMRNTRVDFAYSQFKKSDTEVIILEDEN